MTLSPLRSTLDQYLSTFADHPGLAHLVPLLRREFLPGISSIARFGYTSPQELYWGDAGIELLHDVCEQLLDGELAGDAERGALIRLVSRLAHRRFRAVARRVEARSPEALDLEPTSVRQRTRRRLEGFDHVLESLDDPLLQKRGGGLHLGRAAARLSIPRKRLGSELKEMGRLLGRGQTEFAFWSRRLGECLVALLCRAVEREVPDILPSTRDDRSLFKRVRKLLDRLTRMPAPPEYRDVLRDVRSMSRRQTCSVDELLFATEHLAPDRFSVRLAEAEWTRAGGDASAALVVLAAVRDAAAAFPDAGSTRRTILVSLAEARCFETLGHPRRASDLLEAHASLHRADPLLVYNRLVLAEAAGVDDRAAAARRDLHRLRSSRMPSPLLAQRIRERLRPN